MSVEFWTNAEQFYEMWIFFIGSIFAISLMVLIFVINYSNNENLRKNILIVIGFTTLLVFVGFTGHRQYRTYLEQASYINPLIRDRKPTLIGYQYYSSAEQQFYTEFNDLDSLREMILYEEDRIIEPVIYLGQAGYFHYFERSNGELFKEHKEVAFLETAQQAEVVGSQFTLKDESFLEIGFKNPENTMFKRIEVPASIEGLTYNPQNDFLISTTKDVFLKWNF